MLAYSRHTSCDRSSDIFERSRAALCKLFTAMIGRNTLPRFMKAPSILPYHRIANCKCGSLIVKRLVYYANDRRVARCEVATF
jgi:hypothetical protein